MSVNEFCDDVQSQLHFETSMVHQEREEDEAVAMPEKGEPEFYCAMSDQCVLGDPWKTVPGTNKMEYLMWQWHEVCFFCVVCRLPIGNQKFMWLGQQIFCISCYLEGLGPCVKCHKIITQYCVTYKKMPWHHECFTCTNCNILLTGNRFTSKDESPYCQKCFVDFSTRCVLCTRPVIGVNGVRLVSPEGRVNAWHVHCFSCAKCKACLVGKGFSIDGARAFCDEH